MSIVFFVMGGLGMWMRCATVYVKWMLRLMRRDGIRMRESMRDHDVLFFGREVGCLVVGVSVLG